MPTLNIIWVTAIQRAEVLKKNAARLTTGTERLLSKDTRML